MAVKLEYPPRAVTVPDLPRRAADVAIVCLSRLVLLAAWASFIPLVAGCASPLRSIDTAREAFVAGDLSNSLETLTEVAESNGRFADAAALDLAIVELSTGQFLSAEQRLRALRDQFDNQPDVAPVHTAAAIVTDDTSRLYRPAGYEQVMIRAILALCSLAGDGQDAESYSMQATMLQTKLADDADGRGVLGVDELYQPIALAPYLRGVLREATHHDYDDAVRAYQLVSDVRPQFAPAGADIARASGGAHSQAGNGVLYVFACVGRGPQLSAVDAPTTTTAMQIASATLSAQTNRNEDGCVGGVVIPNIASVKVPAITIPPSSVASIGTQIDGQNFGATQTLTDVGSLAERQLTAEMPWTIARAVVRRSTKEATVAGVGNTLGLNGMAGTLFHFAASTLWSSTESADTRCWGLLPREIQVLRAEIPAGQHSVSLQPLGYDGQPIATGIREHVEIIDGHNHYLIAIAPDHIIHLANPTR